MLRTNTTSTTKSRRTLPYYRNNRRTCSMESCLVNLLILDRGNLSNKSLASIVKPSTVVRDSDYLETHLVAIPNQITKDFLKTYENASPMVVPRSALELDADSEFTLYAVTTFKKHSAEFIHKCREKRWTPRAFEFKEGGNEAEKKEFDKVSKDERKVWGEALRLGRTAWGEAVMAWIHVLALRVFVETVLRYGLPLSFVCGLITVCRSSQPKDARDTDKRLP